MMHLNTHLHLLLFNQDLLMLLSRMNYTDESHTLQDPGLTWSLLPSFKKQHEVQAKL